MRARSGRSKEAVQSTRSSSLEPAARLVWDLQWGASTEGEQLVGEGRAFDEAVQRFAGTPARGHDPSGLVKHDDDLPALLDEHLRPLGAVAGRLGFRDTAE